MDATVLVANEELASNYGRDLPCFRDEKDNHSSQRR